MKQILSILTLALSLTVFQVKAANTIDGPVVGDDNYFGSVQIASVQLPSGENAVDSSSATIEGTGSVTVSAQQDFPRISVVGGTTIKSTRDWGVSTDREWWNGELKPPAKSLNPETDVIQNLGFSDEIEISQAFKFGQDNETFSFTIPARVALPVDELQNQALFVAYKQSDGTWEATDQGCYVISGLCVVDIQSVSSLVLYKKKYQACPFESINNGEIAPKPSCVVSCNNGYYLGCDGQKCIKENCSGEACSCDDLGRSVAVQNNQPTTNAQIESYYKSEQVRRAQTTPDGYYSYRGSRVDRSSVIDTAGLSEAEAEKVRKINLGIISRGSNGGPKEKAEEKTESDKNSSFLDYLLSARGHFGEGNSANVFGAEQANQARTDSTVGKVDMSDQYHSSAQLLPSTGPGFFIGLAVLGLALMVFGSLRRS